eukprot:802369_1
MEEYKKSMQLLQANLVESKSDQSDLINALQQEWEQCKQELMRYKQKCRQLIHEKDELIARDVARNGLAQINLQTATPINNYQNYNNNSFSDAIKQAQPIIKTESTAHSAEMIVQLNEVQRKLQQKEDEVKSQEMLMKQLMEQQKAFQKRNKKLVARLNAIKKQKK